MGDVITRDLAMVTMHARAEVVASSARARMNASERATGARSRGANGGISRGARARRRDVERKASSATTTTRNRNEKTSASEGEDDRRDVGPNWTKGGGRGEGDGGGARVVVFSGGTAMNGITMNLSAVTSKVTHVIPVSDNGGSTSEIVRVLGGPAVGDLRSRCLRLSDESTPEAVAVKKLLAHRLHPTDSALARGEWYKIQEGEHELWDGIGDDYANIIRRFLVHFHQEVTSSTVKGRFDFVNGSIGNFFFAGARLFFRSMDAAIFLYSRVSRIPADTVVVPCILSEDNARVNLAAELVDGTIIRGQNEISHPSIDSKKFSKDMAFTSKNPDVVSKEFWTSVLESGEFPELEAHEMWGGLRQSSRGFKSVRDALKSGSLSDAAELLQSRFIDIAYRPLSVWDVNKVVTAYDPLPSPIKRVFYASSINANDENFEVHPKVNPTVEKKVAECDVIVYGMGSLYTSIVPNLALKTMGDTIANASCKKVLMLNGGHDRETGTMTASEIVQAVVDALNMKYTSVELEHSVLAYVTDVVAPRGGGVRLDVAELAALGLRVHECDSFPAPVKNAIDTVHYEPRAFVDLLTRIVAETGA